MMIGTYNVPSTAVTNAGFRFEMVHKKEVGKVHRVR